MLPAIDEQLAELAKHARDPAGYGAASRSDEHGGGGGGGGDGDASEFWDDRCLAHFLRGICLRYVAYPEPDAVLLPGEEEEVRASRAESEKGAKEAFEAVFRDGPKVVYDHYLVYYARESPFSSFITSVYFFGSVNRGADEGGRPAMVQISSMRGCWRAWATRTGRGRTSRWCSLVSRVSFVPFLTRVVPLSPSAPSLPPTFDPIESGRRGVLTQLRTGKPLEVAPGARKVRLICVLAFGCEDAADEVRFPFDRWRRSVGRLGQVQHGGACAFISAASFLWISGC